MSDCEVCPVEKDCYYPYKLCDCIHQRKFRSAQDSRLKPNTDLHFHQCGRITAGWVEGYGCGHIWQHCFTFALTHSIVADHKCPACNCGPWYYELSPEEVANAQAKESAI